jgi:hypothetical protein
MTDAAIARGFGRMKWTELAENRAAVKATVAPEKWVPGQAEADRVARHHTLQMPPNFHVSVDWTYGTLIAAGAALLALGIAVAGLRPDGL